MMRIHVFVRLLTCLLLPCCLQAQVPDSLAAHFKYRPVPGAYKIDSSYSKDGARVERITYLGSDSFLVSAYIVRPLQQVPIYSLMIAQHWSEGNKDEFLEEAIQLAPRGWISILDDAPWLCPGSPIRSFKRQGYEMYRQSVINARSALNLAEAHFPIDSSRILFVGHSIGCNVGAILSAIEPRFDYFIFMAGLYSVTENLEHTELPDFVAWRQEDPAQFADWIRRMRPLDVKHYLPYKTKPCLIQVALQDEFISNPENEAFIRHTPEPKEARRYQSDHGLNEEARRDRLYWIHPQIEVPKGK